MTDFKAARAIRLVIRGETSFLSFDTDSGRVSLELNHADLKAIAHLIADGFRDFGTVSSTSEAGVSLEPVAEATARLDSIPGRLGLEEKLVLTVKSESGTTVRQRLDPDQAEQLLQSMDLALALRGKRQ